MPFHVCYSQFCATLSYHPTCDKLDFAYTWRLKLDVFQLPCNSRSIKVNFLLPCSLRLKVFPFIVDSRSVKLTFAHSCSSTLNLYLVSHVILGVLNSILQTIFYVILHVLNPIFHTPPFDTDFQFKN